MLRGVDGVQRRMAELQAKLDSLNPRPAPSEPPGPNSFAADLARAQPGGLAGQIGGPFAPLDPTGFDLRPSMGSPELRSMAVEAALRNGIDPGLFEALVEQESGFDPMARSRVGAMGLSQLMPDTARSLGVNNPFDPAENLDGGARYLSQMLDRFGDPKLALAAYNAGPGAVEKFGNQVPPYQETQKYVDRIMSRLGSR